MKKIIIPVLVVGAMTLGLIGCKGDTELSFKNSNNSSNKINDIVWGNENQTWNSTTGYAIDTTTESKKVTELNSDIQCSVFDPNAGDYVAPSSTIFPEEGSTSISLEEGAANSFTVEVKL